MLLETYRTSIKISFVKTVRLSLERKSPPNNNINKPKFDALKSLSNNKNIVVLKAYKRGAVVILDKDDYRWKMLDHLHNSGCCKKVNKDPVKKISKSVALSIKASSSASSLIHKLI